MKNLIRKINILYFFKSIIFPVDLRERKVIKKNFFKYFLYCIKNKKNKVIVASYPSSGWNFFNSVINNYLNIKLKSNNIKFFRSINIKNSLKRKSNLHNLHSHLCYFEIPFFGPGNIKKNKKIIITRNYITTLFSYYKKYNRNYDFNKFILEGNSLERLVEYYNSWAVHLEETNNYFIVKYETLKKNPNKYFKEIIELLYPHLNFENTILKKALKNKNFKKIKNKKKDVFLGKDNYQNLIEDKTLNYLKKYLRKNLSNDTKKLFAYKI